MAAVTRDQALDALAARLSERSLAHCVAVAQAAERLASLYAVDVDDAWLAGLLHDWSRDLSNSELVDAARGLGMQLSEVDLAVPYLLHARVAASELREGLPGVAPQVVDAVERHTVGVAGMTGLDMCVYIADMIEPARRYDGVEELRELAGSIPLEELYGRAYARSLTHLIGVKKYIHPASVAAWNAIVAKDRS